MSFQLNIDADLELRELRIHEAPQLFEVVEKNRAHLRRWLPWLDHNKKVEDSENFIRNAAESNLNGSTLILGVFFRSHLKGMLSFVPLQKQLKSGTIGYWLCESVQRQGIMRRCVQALMQHGFQALKLHRIEIRVNPENRASKRIPESLGYTFEGVSRGSSKMYGEFEDLAVYSKLKSDPL